MTDNGVGVRLFTPLAKLAKSLSGPGLDKETTRAVRHSVLHKPREFIQVHL